jgi:hypothetical protein
VPKPLLALVLGASLCIGVVGCAPRTNTKPHKTLTRNVFYIGMSADEALSRLPSGYALEPLGLLHEYGPNGPTADELKLDEYFGITDAQCEDAVPLWFNRDKMLVRAGPTFDEDKYVNLYEQRKSKKESQKGDNLPTAREN